MTTSRNASLDGLRAIAVLLVLLYHHGLLNSGWLGVDIFFVLSGFLITTILRRDRDTQDYWSRFWMKRTLRIMPPLVLVLLLTAGLSFPVSRIQAAAYLFSLGDVLAYVRPGFEPLRPLWSLAVEEHFYLLWPFAVRYCRRRTLLIGIIGLIALEPLLRGVASVYKHQWELTYFLTPFRLDGLAAGSLLAMLLEDARSAERIRRWSAPAGLFATMLWVSLRVLLGTAFTRGNPTVSYNACCYSLVAAVCVCGIAFLITHPKSLAVRVLQARLLAWLGLISYGLYLYQVPVHEAVIRLQPRFAHVALLVDGPITLALAAASYYVVERPAMRAGHSKTRLMPQTEVDRVTSPAL